MTTETVAEPADPAGDKQVIDVLDTTLTDPQAEPPTVTVAPVANPAPEMVREVPPAVLPVEGLIPVTVGAGPSGSGETVTVTVGAGSVLLLDPPPQPRKNNGLASAERRASFENHRPHGLGMGNLVFGRNLEEVFSFYQGMEISIGAGNYRRIRI